jgi:hypothetical protein
MPMRIWLPGSLDCFLGLVVAVLLLVELRWMEPKRVVAEILCPLQ